MAFELNKNVNKTMISQGKINGSKLELENMNKENERKNRENVF